MNVPLAPDDGAVKVTCTPVIGLPPDVTATTNGAANTLPAVALCPFPPVAIVVTAGAVFEFEKPQLARKSRARQVKAARVLT
jgi:hypothetical protein